MDVEFLMRNHFSPMPVPIARDVADRPSVIVIDDSESICALLELVLDLEGFSAVSTTDPERGLRLVEAAPPDALVVDLTMPHLDGFEIIYRIRSEAALDQVAVVVLTGWCRPGLEDELRDRGADSVFLKPFDPATLCDDIRSQIAVRQGHPAVVADVQRAVQPPSTVNT